MTIDLDKLTSSIKLHEGLKLKPYQDTVGKTTIGYGRNLTDDGITQGEANILLSDDITVSISQCEVEPWWPHVAGVEPRARACCELMFILGPTKFAGFRNAVAALLADNFTEAANQIIDSVLDHEDGERINILAGMISSGNDPG